MGKLKEVKIEPTREWGYFCGLVVGDGTVRHEKRHYDTVVRSTKPEVVDVFAESARRLNLKPIVYQAGPYRRKLANGKVRMDVNHIAVVQSKVVSGLLKRCKLGDYHFVVPNFARESRETICGFLQGFFDAEGGIERSWGTTYSKGRPYKRTWYYIKASSKHKGNLLQIAELLRLVGVESRIRLRRSTNSWELYIYDNLSKLRFTRLVGFRLQRKKGKLIELLRNIKRFDLKPTGTRVHVPRALISALIARVLNHKGGATFNEENVARGL